MSWYPSLDNKRLQMADGWRISFAQQQLGLLLMGFLLFVLRRHGPVQKTSAKKRVSFENTRFWIVRKEAFFKPPGTSKLGKQFEGSPFAASARHL
jgi:hypothetical protein